MDISEDFLRPDLIGQILFARRSVVIEPFTLATHLAPLKQIFEVFFRITEFDPQQLSQLENLQLFLDELENSGWDFEESGQRPLLLIPALTPKTMEMLAGSRIPFLGINKDISTDQQRLPTIAIFNKKTNTMINQLPVDAELTDWAGSIIDKIRAVGIDDTLDYLRELFGTSKDLCVLGLNYSESKYQKLMGAYSTREQVVIRWLCEHYFEIKLDTLVPNDERNDDTGKVSADLPIYDSESPEVRGFYQELLDFRALNPIMAADFVQPLASQTDDVDRQSPEDVYCYLRQTAWKGGIPQDYFYLVFERLLRARARNQKLKDIRGFIQTHYTHFFNAISPLPGADLMPQVIEENHYLQLPEIIAADQGHHTSTLPVKYEKQKSVAKSKISPDELAKRKIGRKKSTARPKAGETLDPPKPVPTTQAPIHAKEVLPAPKIQDCPSETLANRFYQQRHRLYQAFRRSMDKHGFLMDQFQNLKYELIKDE
jgi:hypothetical protein